MERTTANDALGRKGRAEGSDADADETRDERREVRPRAAARARARTQTHHLVVLLREAGGALLRALALVVAPLRLDRLVRGKHR